MLYTRFVIGEETLSSTSIFSFSQWASFSITIKSFMKGPFNEQYRQLSVRRARRDRSASLTAKQPAIEHWRFESGLCALSAGLAMGLTTVLGVSRYVESFLRGMIT